MGSTPAVSVTGLLPQALNQTLPTAGWRAVEGGEEGSRSTGYRGGAHGQEQAWRGTHQPACPHPQEETEMTSASRGMWEDSEEHSAVGSQRTQLAEGLHPW